MNTAVEMFDASPEPSPRTSAAPQLRTLLLTDLVDSMSLVERLGDGPASDLFRAHDRLVLQLQQQWRGRLIDRSDGLLLLFERPIDGLGFALDYVRGLTALGEERGVSLRARAGLHVGEVLTWRNSEEAVSIGAKPLEVEGLAKPIAARLMAMARPGQILLSAVAEPLAHRAARELGERGQHLAWKSWGRWRFKGVPEPQQIFEVGEPGVAPLRMPPNTPKAWRDIPLWRRPAALAAEAALLAAGVLGAWFITRPEPAIAFNQRDWVVVGDLRNLTGQSALDDSLEQAFRISLEQSRYVNVLSDLKVRNTLGNMRREQDTVVDRAVASEIALRDGARAVILPTVAEVGGRVRVSAEVIDPRTQTTVYTESAEGSGITSTLDSIDDVTAALRGKLGEAVKSIEKDSAPLPQVTTGNLDALRAYALGQKAYASGKYADAQQYFQRAIQLDPEFALAYVGQMRIFVSDVDAAKARAAFDRALSLRTHLPPRDALYLDAWAAEFAPRSATLAPEKWKLLAGMYPDYYAGPANYSWGAFYLGQYDSALQYARRATASQNPLRPTVLDQVGRIQLARGQYADALKNFQQSVKEGRLPSRQMAAAYAATRDFDQASKILAAQAGDDLIPNVERISLLVDQRRDPDALVLAKEVETRTRTENAYWRDLFRAVRLSVATIGDARPPADEYSQAVVSTLDSLDPASLDAADRFFFALTASYLAQAAGHQSAVAPLLPRLAKVSASLADPRCDEMLLIVRANQKRLEGDAGAAIAMLSRRLDGHELFQTHVVLREAYEASGRAEEAEKERRWIAMHRGLAYGERAGSYALQPLNVWSARSAAGTAPAR